MSGFKFVPKDTEDINNILRDNSRKPVIHDFYGIVEQNVTPKRHAVLPSKPKQTFQIPDMRQEPPAHDKGQQLVTDTVATFNEVDTPDEVINQETNYAGECEINFTYNLCLKAQGEVLNKVTEEPEFYRIGDVYEGRRVAMKHLGLDIGTKTIVLAFKGGRDKTSYISEINGYWPFERATTFVEHMLNDPKKVRADGTTRPARWIKLNDRIIVLGRDAEEFAYAKNDTLLRPMSEGGITADEEAMTVLASIISGLLETAETELGEFEDEIKLCYCTTAPAINKDSNLAYHERVINMIIDNYKSKTSISRMNIKESHAIVLNMSPDGTGIGISWGAGTVTVSYVRYGLEIYSFCWVGAGDWIDEQVALRHGYNPELSKTRKKVSKETPTTVAKRKTEVDLTPGKEPDDRVGLDIALHYDVLISQVIDGIVQGFVENESQAKIDDQINIYMAGGTSSPKGFVKRVEKKLEEKEAPFTVGKILIAEKPLFCVAEGCLKAAEMS